jgi:GTP-binding protein
MRSVSALVSTHLACARLAAVRRAGTSADDRLRAVHAAMGGGVAEEIERRMEKGKFFEALDRKTDNQWLREQSHLRRQDAAVAKLGMEGAIRETLAPSHASRNAQLRARKLDKTILAEIHKEMHGRRAERLQRKGWQYERFVMTEEKNTPVHSASDRAKETFGFGAKITVLGQSQSVTDFPVSKVPEIAFIGRTNSGRSSLINALTNNVIAPYGALAGTTTTANFYQCGAALTLVDLPGYGPYNPVQTAPLDATNAMGVSRQYLRTCGYDAKSARNVKRVFVCVHHLGFHHDDLKHFDLLDRIGANFGVLVMKTDTAPIRMLAKRVDEMRETLGKYPRCQELMMVNALRHAGIVPLQTRIASMARRADGGTSVDDLAREVANIV